MEEKRDVTAKTNTFRDPDIYSLQYGKIHFTIWTNMFYNRDKYI